MKVCDVDESAAVPLSAASREALLRTRPWMYFLGVVSIVGAVFCAVLILAGALGFDSNAGRAMVLMTTGIIGGIIATVYAALQLGYAGALSEVEHSEGSVVEQAVERACVRQRRLWIAIGVVSILSMLGYLIRTIVTIAHGAV